MLDAICDVLRISHQLQWISSRDGNASFRPKNEKCIYVTPSGVRKQHLNKNMILKLQLTNDRESLYTYENKGLQPTGELKLHLLLQKSKQDRVVLHLHPTFIISAMYAGIDLQEISRIFPEINRYTRVGPTVPEVPPISEKLAEETVKAFGIDKEGNVKYDIIGLKQHGVVIIANDIWTAFEHCERLEHICHIVLASGKNKHISRL